MNTAGPDLNKIRALRRANRCSDATISQISLDIRRAREALEATKPKRGRKERDYLGDFNACFPDFEPAETYEQLFFRIAIVSGLLGSDAKAYEYVAARHPTGKSASGAPILPNHLADARKNNLKAERATVGGTVTIKKTRRPRQPRRLLAYSRLVAGLDRESGPMRSTEVGRTERCGEQLEAIVGGDIGGGQPCEGGGDYGTSD